MSDDASCETTTNLTPPTAEIEACRETHDRLIASLEAVDDVVARRPSRLPDWTIGHVLTHIARNADSFVRILEAAAEGQQVTQYPGGPAQRTGEIETGATRPAAAIVNDVRSATARLDAAFRDAQPAAWAGTCVVGHGSTITCDDLPRRRRREVEVHHVDLGLGYEPGDWPEDFVAGELAMALRDLPGRIEDAAQRASLLAWVAGRVGEPERIDLLPY